MVRKKASGTELDATKNVYKGISKFLQPRGMKLFHHNINGITKKVSNVKLLLQETKHKIDIFGVTETHLHKNIMDEEIKIEGYTFVRKDRISDLEGGRYN